MAAKDVVGNDLPERARRKQAQQRMNCEEVVRPEEVRRSAEGIRDYEGLLLGPPERSLAPLGKVDGPQNLKRRAGHAFARGPVQRNVAARSELGAVPLVPVKELDHAHDPSRGIGPCSELRIVDGVDQPYAPVVHESM